MIIMTTIEIITIEAGESSILELDSSKYLVNPPCPEGIDILLSFANL